MVPWRALRLPLASCQVDTPSTVTGIVVARPRRDERHTLLFEHRALPLRAANAKPGASEPSRNTTRWQGITPGSGLACSAKPTNLALRGRPASVATWP